MTKSTTNKSKTKVSKALTYELFVKRTWNNIRHRSKNSTAPQYGDRNCLRYIKKGICLFMTKPEFQSFCEDNKAKIKRYIKGGKRPSVDRINALGHYQLDNIRILPLALNIALARH